MKGKGAKLLLWMASALLACSSAASAAHEARDKAAGCFKKIVWQESSFGAQDDPEEIFVSADAFDQLAGCVKPAAPAMAVPTGRIVHGGRTYVRSPQYPGACDALKEDRIRYEWCTGARGPATHDPKLIGCTNEYCDFSVADTRRRFGGN
jgi:hypothetical protein